MIGANLRALALAGALALSATGAMGQQAAPVPEAGQWVHGISLHGELKYPQGFAHYDYVNPDAPKGGVVRLSDLGGFDTFNPILPQGEPAPGLGLIYDTLMTAPEDELSTHYGQIAQAMSYPADFSSVTFRLDPDARWHDGQPITAQDVIWSYGKVIELNPDQKQYYINVAEVSETAPGEVTFRFDQTGNRELPYIMGQLLILPQHWWEATGPNGQPRTIGSSTLEPPLGSGPYKIKSFTAGRTVVYERVADYWGATKNFGVGQNNFDEVRYELFRDTTVEFEAFKGDQFDWWLENQARRWATGYDFPAANDGRVVRETFDNPYRSTGVMVGFAPNLRQAKFQDKRVRRALNLAFDFEELNRTIFYGQYERIDSFFYGIPLRWQGLPQGEELEILESVRDLVPASVFTEQYKNPVAGDATALRANLREALGLLTQAGYTLSGNQLVNANGEQLSFEILLNGPTIEPVATAWQNNLRSIGIAASIRTVDSPQYIQRLRARDFDVVYVSWAQSQSPGNEQRFFFGSAAAAEPGSRNYGGIADPGVDALIEKVIFADDRETLEAATHALDRVLMAHDFLVPTYTSRNARTARWDRFSHPQTLPEYGIGFPTSWWWDADKAAKTGGR